MALVINRLLQNLKIKYKVFLIFIILVILMIDLGALNITSVYDIQRDTDRIAEKLIPRLIETTSIKDNLNLSILAAYDYVQTGNVDSKAQYEKSLQEALKSQIALFYLATSEEDLEFTASFDEYINATYASLINLMEAYDQDASKKELSARLNDVSIHRDNFAQFLEEEIEIKIQNESQEERQLTEQQVQRTIINVIIVGLIAIVALILVYSFIHRSVTEPVRKLTEAAEEISKGNFRAVNIDSRDELGLFAETFNTMIQKLQATQESLQIELEKTKKLDQQKTEFLSIAAHQLRTPMSGIKWVVSMVAEDDLGKIPEEAREQLQKGLENIERMISLINSLLDVTQIETEHLKFNFESTDIVEHVRETVHEFDPIFKATEVQLIFEEPTNKLPPVRVDKNKIKMAIRNLIDNAIKYTSKKGTVTISFELNDDMVILNIKDSGYGIPKNEQDRIFSKFFRGSNIQTVQADGSGLGLFVVHEIVAQHEGSVTFESAENEGTTFSVELPIFDE